MRRVRYEGETDTSSNEPLALIKEPSLSQEPLLISMDDLGQVLRAGKTTCFKLVGSGEIESVLIGRKRMPVFEPVKAYVARLRAQSSTSARAA